MGPLVNVLTFFPGQLARLGLSQIWVRGPKEVLSSHALIDHSGYTSQARRATTMIHINITRFQI
jgi:hypothetical protein